MSVIISLQPCGDMGMGSGCDDAYGDMGVGSGCDDRQAGA